MKKKFNTVFHILTGNAFAQLIVIFTTPILTRLYKPDDFGSLAIANGLILTLGVIGCARYDQLVFKYNNRRDWNKCYTNAIFYAYVIILSTFPILFFFREYIGIYYLFSIPILIFTFSLSQIYSSILSVVSNYTKITQSLIIKSLFIFISQYILFDYLGKEGLVVGLVVGQVVQSLFLFILVKKEKEFYFQRELVSRPSRDSIMSSLQSLSNSFSSQLPSLFIPFRYGLELMGYYSMALRLTYIPITFLSNALRPFVLGEINNNINNKDNLYKTITLFTLLLILVAIIGIFLINIFAADFFVIYAGPGWEVSGKISGILSFWILLAFSNILSTSYLTVFSKFKQLLIYDALLLVVRIGIVLISIVFNLEFLSFVKLYSLAGFVFNLSIIIYTLWLVNNEKNLHCHSS
ncbi:TPA: lipopolysaccharide biosynthesis protein [Photobacterium damselae]